jgi:hypothetical protein
VAVFVIVNMLVAVLVVVLVAVLVAVLVEVLVANDSPHVNSEGITWRLPFDPAPGAQSGPSRGTPFHSTGNSPSMRE